MGSRPNRGDGMRRQMCGIVGLHLKDDALADRLGGLVAGMLDCMAERGPDSAGIAIYGDPLPEGALRCSVRATAAGVDWDAVAARLATRTGADVRAQPRGSDAAMLVARGPEASGGAGAVAAVVEALRTSEDVRLVGFGRSVEVFKDVGAPRAICERYGIAGQRGVRALGHTRMATESAVTTDHSHPFVPAADLSLIHNGSFSNYATVRRRLQREGVRFDTDNDSEVAARFLAQQLAQGHGLEDALRLVQKHLDGFFTLLIGTLDGFAVLRDSFACKPAVVAETDAYVAVASEFRALAGLPGIADAATFEPKPEEIYLWQR
jgi:methylamine---glutamate N-methyltransferase subunit A